MTADMVHLTYPVAKENRLTKSVFNYLEQSNHVIMLI
jgi:hypothetical protein